MGYAISGPRYDSQTVLATAGSTRGTNSLIDLPGAGAGAICQLSTKTGGLNFDYEVVFVGQVTNSGILTLGGGNTTFQIFVNGVGQDSQQQWSASGSPQSVTMCFKIANVGNGQIIKVQWSVQASTTTLGFGRLTIFGVPSVNVNP